MAMQVLKRDGRREDVTFDKITARVHKLCYGLDPQHISSTLVSQKVVQGVYDGVTTVALDDLAAETAAYLTTTHPDYARLAARIAVSNLHKETQKSFSATVQALHAYINPRNGQKAPLVSDEVAEIVMANAERLDAAIMCARSPYPPRALFLRALRPPASCTPTPPSAPAAGAAARQRPPAA